MFGARLESQENRHRIGNVTVPPLSVCLFTAPAATPTHTTGLAAEKEREREREIKRKRRERTGGLTVRSA
jgi:hypothetical protein